LELGECTNKNDKEQILKEKKYYADDMNKFGAVLKYLILED